MAKVNKADKQLNDKISALWPKLAHGVQVPIMKLPAIFNDIRAAVASGIELETAIKTAADKFRVN